MTDEDAVLKEMLKLLDEAARRIRASRHLMKEHALDNEPNYLRLAAQLSEALDVAETARRGVRRHYDAGPGGTSP
jgi:hypothetical protein